jgi:4-hydroxyphenylpyruvate dioxygenase
MKRGARSLYGANSWKDEFGEVVRSDYTYGETVHVFLLSKNYKGVFLPGYKEWKSDYNQSQQG